MQNSIDALLEELKHLRRTQVHPPIQNVQVAQAADRRQIEDNAEDITKRVKVDALDLMEEEILISSSIGLS